MARSFRDAHTLQTWHAVDSLVPASRYSFRNQGRALMHICSHAVLNISVGNKLIPELVLGRQGSRINSLR
jgi:hypothetical protein